jgi:hypothetical protein
MHFVYGLVIGVIIGFAGGYEFAQKFASAAIAEYRNLKTAAAAVKADVKKAV